MAENNGNSKFWKNRVKVFHCQTFEELEKQLNEFNEKEWVIATQIHPILRENYMWVAIVYFKQRPD